jgi:hypothetical protein
MSELHDFLVTTLPVSSRQRNASQRRHDAANGDVVASRNDAIPRRPKLV